MGYTTLKILSRTPRAATRGNPNPARQNVFLVTLSSFTEETSLSIRIIDLTGKVHLEQLVLTDKNGAAKVQVANTFASGLYLIEAFNGADRYVDKIVITR